jgi:hypothetical protein
MDLVNRLEAIPGPTAGTTLLDQSLVVWGQESGNVTHMSISMPVIAAGSAGGALATNNYCDFRNLNRQLDGDNDTGTETNFLWSGAIYNQWLGTCLQAMGIPASEWATQSTHPGYGPRVSYDPVYNYYFTNKGFTDTDCYTDQMWQQTNQILPFLKP